MPNYFKGSASMAVTAVPYSVETLADMTKNPQECGLLELNLESYDKVADFAGKLVVARRFTQDHVGSALLTNEFETPGIQWDTSETLQQTRDSPLIIGRLLVKPETDTIIVTDRHPLPPFVIPLGDSIGPNHIALRSRYGKIYASEDTVVTRYRVWLLSDTGNDA